MFQNARKTLFFYHNRILFEYFSDKLERIIQSFSCEQKIKHNENTFIIITAMEKNVYNNENSCMPFMSPIYKSYRFINNILSSCSIVHLLVQCILLYSASHAPFYLWCLAMAAGFTIHIYICVLNQSTPTPPETHRKQYSSRYSHSSITLWNALPMGLNDKTPCCNSSLQWWSAGLSPHIYIMRYYALTQIECRNDGAHKFCTHTPLYSRLLFWISVQVCALPGILLV